MALATLSIDLVAKLAQFEADLGKAARAAEQQSQRMAQALGAVATAAGALLGAVSVGAVTALVRAQIDAIDGFNDLADSTGASIENISALDNLARRTGATFETVSGSLLKFNKTLGEADANNGAGQIFKSLGLDVEALRKADPVEALRTTAIALAGFADDGDKARVVQELFGKSVREAAPLLKDLAEATSFAGSVTAEQAGEVDAFNKAIFRLQAGASDVVRTMSLELLPTLNTIITEFGKGGGAVGAMESVTSALKIALQGVAVLGSDLLFVFRGIGREIGAIAAQGAAVGRLDFRGAAAIRQELIADNEAARRDLDAFQRRVLGLEAPAAGAAAPARPSLGGQRAGGGAPAAVRTGASLGEQGAKLADALLAQDGGLSGDFIEKWDKLGAAYRSGAISLDKLTQAQAVLLKQQPFAKQAAEDLGDLGDQLSRKLEADARAAERVARLNAELNTLSGRTAEDRKIALTQQLEERLGAGEIFSPEELDRIVRGIGGVTEATDKAAASAVNFADVFSSRFEDAIVKGEKLGTVLKSLAQDIAQVVIRQTITKPLADAASSFLAGSFKFANGGIMTSAGAVPLRKYASGGVATSPQLALFGEGSTPEAYVPLPDGRRIPVAMKGGPRSSGTVVVNITTTDVASKRDLADAVRAGLRSGQADRLRTMKYGGE